MRITIPEGAHAIIMGFDQAQELYDLCRLIRSKGAKAVKENEGVAHSICGEFMLAYIEAKDRA